MADFNASDRKSIRAAEKGAAIAERQHGEVVVEMMATQARRRYIWDKLSAAHIFATTFSTDPIQMSFNEGQRNQGLVLLNDIIQYCPEQFIQAMRESNERNTSSGPSDGSNSGELDGSSNRNRRDQGSASDPASGLGEPGPEDIDGAEGTGGYQSH